MEENSRNPVNNGNVTKDEEDKNSRNEVSNLAAGVGDLNLAQVEAIQGLSAMIIAEIDQLKETSVQLMCSSQYMQALEQLEKLNNIQPKQLKTMLMIAECNLHLERQQSAVAMVHNIRNMIMTEPRPTIENMINEAYTYEKNSNFLIAFILLYCASYLHMAKSSSEEALAGVKLCFDRIYNVNEEANAPILDGKEKYNDLLVELLWEMATSISQVETLDQDLKVRVHVRCLGCVVFGLVSNDRSEEALATAEDSIAMLIDQFGNDAAKCHLLGELQHNIAYVHYTNDNLDLAKLQIEESIISTEQAEDYIAESKKTRNLGYARQLLSIVNFTINNPMQMMTFMPS